VNLQTAELVKALHAVAKYVPQVATDLLTGAMLPARQHEFATLLTELSELLHSHADDQATGVIPTVRFEAEDEPVMSRDVLREAPAASSNGDEPPGP
jgi:hypothetical protein